MTNELYDYLSKTQCSNNCLGVGTATFKRTDDCFVHQFNNEKFIVWTKPFFIANVNKEPTTEEKKEFKNHFPDYSFYSIFTYLSNESESVIFEGKLNEIT